MLDSLPSTQVLTYCEVRPASTPSRSPAPPPDPPWEEGRYTTFFEFASVLATSFAASILRTSMKPEPAAALQ